MNRSAIYIMYINDEIYIEVEIIKWGAHHKTDN